MQDTMLTPQSQGHTPAHPGLQEYSMVPPADHPAHLSVTGAFVVQFRADAVVEQGLLAGRVEHVISGQAKEKMECHRQSMAGFPCQKGVTDGYDNL